VRAWIKIPCLSLSLESWFKGCLQSTLLGCYEERLQ
jgi:hypothetical protein